MVLLFPFNKFVFQSDKKELPRIYPEDVTVFFSTLARGLDNLEKIISAEGFSFSFVCSALDILRSTHSGVLLVAEKLRRPSCQRDEEWINDYMEETVKLLDVCHMLKEGVSGMEQYHVLVHVVAGALGTVTDLKHQCSRAVSALVACKQEMSCLENEHKVLTERKVGSEGNLSLQNLSDKRAGEKCMKWNGCWGILSAMKVTNSYICRLLLSTVVHVGPCRFLKLEALAFGVPWRNSFMRLQQRVNEEIMKSKKCTFVLLKEVEDMETVLGELRLQMNAGALSLPEDVEKIRQRALSLNHLLQKFQTGVEAFDRHFNDLFDGVTKGRCKLLDMIGGIPS